MFCKVLKPFPYGHDGVHAEQLVAGDEREIHDDLFPGLKAEGFVEPAAPPKAGAGGKPPKPPKAGETAGEPSPAADAAD